MDSLAYHVVVHALEGRAGWTPATRFAATISHLINGHLPYQRYHAAGCARAAQGITEGQIEHAIRDFLVTDLSAGSATMSRLRCPAVLLAGFNAYNASAGIAVRTNLTLPANGASAPLVVRRRRDALAADPAPCRAGTLALFADMLALVECNGRGMAPPVKSVSGVAALLGVRSSAAAEVAWIFEREGPMSIADLARALGCHQRTLERKLKAEGVAADTLRQAVRLARASQRLGSADTLTTIAVEEGFSDLAHMTRSFKASAGMQPSMLSALVRADAAAIPS